MTGPKTVDWDAEPDIRSWERSKSLFHGDIRVLTAKKPNMRTGYKKLDVANNPTGQYTRKIANPGR